MQPFDFKKVIEWLGQFLKCPVCGQKYNLDQTRIIDSRQSEAFGEATILIHSDCNKCKSSVMFNIEVKGPEVFSVGMVTDLTRHDSSRFKNRGPISVDEVINIHQSIKAFKGSLIKALSKK
ncbi:MAG: hypothetical protein M1400_01055 [Patescibacteria group bacterium]|nr:hypothetical protein [Patescibacteria group bacterium]